MAQIGNKNVKRGKIWEQALKRALARYSGETVDKGLDMLANKMIRAAMEGDEAASMAIIERIADRMDGKPVAIQEISAEISTSEMSEAQINERIIELMADQVNNVQSDTSETG